MRHPVLFAALFAASSALAGQSMPLRIHDIVKNDRWSLAEGAQNGKPLVIRFRDELRDKPDLSAYPRLVRVLWDYHTDSSGMPDSGANDQMAVFEDRLVKAVEPDTAVLVAVVTNDGHREWLFYTSDVDNFGHKLTKMPQEKDRYPIDVSTESDPEWSAFYEDILAGTGG